MDEKTLDGVLRISRRIAAAPNECIKRCPVSFAKNGECFARRLNRFPSARLQNDRPMRRLERRTTLLQCSGNRFRKSVQYKQRRHFYDRKQSCLKSKPGLSAEIDVVRVLRSRDASRCRSLTRRGRLLCLLSVD